MLKKVNIYHVDHATPFFKRIEIVGFWEQSAKKDNVFGTRKAEIKRD
jgi:hypothetical protein